MRRFICLVFIINILLLYMPGKSYCYALESKPGTEFEVESEYLTHAHFKDRYIDTVSLHILENISEKNNRSVYRGITITRPYGHIVNDNQQIKDSSAIGIGPVYMIRNEKNYQKNYLKH